MINEGVSYHCFNCGFKASWQPGRNVSIKVKKLMKWLNVSDTEINRCMLDALRHKEGIEDTGIKSSIPVFIDKALPLGAEPIVSYLDDLPIELIPVLEYLAHRKLYLEDYNFYWTPEVEHKLSHRVVVPFYYKNEIVGYTARAVEDGIKPKYHSNHPSHFVFNMDHQLHDNKFVIVVEGPFDAMSIDAVSVQTNDISEQQADIIESLGREVIVVPDWDKPGQQMIDRAIEYGWSVSFPVWNETCKDAGEAVERYGRLFVLKAILDAKESNALKIKLKKINY
jgi:hypothetical protein